MQRLLVTGGCGYLGRELVRRAPARGWSVRATWFRRPPDGDAEWVRADLRDPEEASRAVDGVGAVVHTAYRQGEGEGGANVDGTRAVATAAAGRRFVHLSTDLSSTARAGATAKTTYRRRSAPTGGRSWRPSASSGSCSPLRRSCARRSSTAAPSPARRNVLRRRGRASSSTRSARPCR